MAGIRQEWKVQAKVGSFITVYFHGKEFFGEVIDRSVDNPGNSCVSLRLYDKDKMESTGGIAMVPISSETSFVYLEAEEEPDTEE